MNLVEKFGRDAKRGDVLFREGESGTTMFVLIQGQVRITRRIRGQEKHVADLSAGEFFGEMAILNNKPRNATATVMADSKLLAIDPKTFEAMIKSNTEIAVRMIKKLAQRLDVANEQIETLLLRDANSRIVFYIINQARFAGTTTDRGIEIQIDMADVISRTGIDEDKVQAVLERMERSGLLARRGEAICIPEINKLDEFLEFLEMKEKFGGM